MVKSLKFVAARSSRSQVASAALTHRRNRHNRLRRHRPIQPHRNINKNRLSYRGSFRCSTRSALIYDPSNSVDEIGHVR